MEPLALHQACDFIKMFEFSIIKTSMCSELAVMIPAYEDIHLWLASVRAFRVLQVDVVCTLLLHPHWSCYAMTVTFHVVLYRWKNVGYVKLPILDCWRFPSTSCFRNFRLPPFQPHYMHWISRSFALKPTESQRQQLDLNSWWIRGWWYHL